MVNIVKDFIKMQIYRIIKILEDILKEDKVFLESKRSGGGTWCCDCKKNTGVSVYPFWHFYRRELCDRCGKEYGKMLKGLGAYDKLD